MVLFVLGTMLAAQGCGGGGSMTIPPVILSVSLSNKTVTIAQGTVALVPVTVQAPTESVTFAIIGLPGGITESYKESESNPSGLLTLTASTGVSPGTYMPTITVGSSGQTASLTFTLVVTSATKT
jgi:hypothetical protein